jgi:hypothetical protein
VRLRDSGDKICDFQKGSKGIVYQRNKLWILAIVWNCLSLFENRYIHYKGHDVLTQIDHYSHLGKANIFLRWLPIYSWLSLCSTSLSMQIVHSFLFGGNN